MGGGLASAGCPQAVGLQGAKARASGLFFSPFGAGFSEDPP